MIRMSIERGDVKCRSKMTESERELSRRRFLYGLYKVIDERIA